MGKRENIAECRRIADVHDSQAVIVVRVERDGTVVVSTYGENKRKCAVIGKWAQDLFNKHLSVVPFRTLFGWGNKGMAKPLSKIEMLSLTPAQRLAIADYLSDDEQPDKVLAQIS